MADGAIGGGEAVSDALCVIFRRFAVPMFRPSTAHSFHGFVVEVPCFFVSALVHMTMVARDFPECLAKEPQQP